MDLTQKIMRIAIMFAMCLICSVVVASADSGLVTANSLNFRTGPGSDYDIITTLPRGTIVNTIGATGSWTEITYDGNQGYVSSQYITVRKTMTDRSGLSINRESSKGEEIVEYAKKFLGVKYVYGGSSPSGFDCSGLTSYVYKHFGYDINRTASGQASNGVYVSKDELQTGDIVLFRNGGRGIGHAGIYVGDGQFIHSVKPGVGIRTNSLNSGYYADNYVTARRIIR